MSKKTVTFKMPVKSATPAEDDPPPILESLGSESGSDAWVRRAEADQASVAPSLANSLTIDLAAERDFPTVAALMLTIPPMLGWFYLANIMNRYWSRLG